MPVLTRDDMKADVRMGCCGMGGSARAGHGIDTGRDRPPRQIQPYAGAARRPRQPPHRVVRIDAHDVERMTLASRHRALRTAERQHALLTSDLHDRHGEAILEPEIARLEHDTLGRRRVVGLAGDLGPDERTGGLPGATGDRIMGVVAALDIVLIPTRRGVEGVDFGVGRHARGRQIGHHDTGETERRDRLAQQAHGLGTVPRRRKTVQKVERGLFDGHGQPMVGKQRREHYQPVSGGGKLYFGLMPNRTRPVRRLPLSVWYPAIFLCARGCAQHRWETWTWSGNTRWPWRCSS